MRDRLNVLLFAAVWMWSPTLVLLIVYLLTKGLL